MRRFVRHPSSIPIEVTVVRGAAPERSALRNVSAGGLACEVERPLQPGSAVTLRIPLIWPDYRGAGVVAWCRGGNGRFEVGIQFGPRDTFKARMLAQLCQIEQYRQQVLTEQGRALDGEQAAGEWIGLHAREFAAAFPPAEGGDGALS